MMEAGWPAKLIVPVAVPHGLKKVEVAFGSVPRSRSEIAMVTRSMVEIMLEVGAGRSARTGWLFRRHTWTRSWRSWYRTTGEPTSRMRRGSALGTGCGSA
jgi:hypothetical protein